jgi:hypothetical protein
MKTRLEAYKNFEKRISSALDRAGFRVYANPEIGGLRPDFLVRDPDGRTYVIELKAWSPTLRNKMWAIQQAERYREAIGADRAFVLIEGLKRSVPSEGLIAEHDLIDFLSRKPGGHIHPRKKIELPQSKQRTIFAAMPFDPEFDDVFFVAMAEAAKSVRAVAIREDKVEFLGDIVDHIKNDIRGSSAVIADLSQSRADVLYEVGFAHALNKQTIHICSTPLDELPFDVRNVNTTKYVKGQTHRLRGALENRLKAMFP